MNQGSLSRRSTRGTAPYERGDRREAAIFDSLRTLLKTTPLKDINVSDIAEGAGLSRSSLYFYFDTKTKIFNALLKATLDRFAERFEAVLSQQQPIPAAVSALMNLSLETWLENHTILLRAYEAGDTPEIQEQWHGGKDRFVRVTTDWIGRCRSAGILPNTAETPLELSEAFIWLTQKSFYKLFCQPSAHDEQVRRVEALTAISLRVLGHTGV